MASKHIVATSRHTADQNGHHTSCQQMQPCRIPDRYQPPGPPQHPLLGEGEGIAPHLPPLEFGGRQTGHDSSSPCNTLLENALISMPDVEPELDDGQLILAAAEVHFEDHAALRSHSVPCSKSLPSAIKRSASHHPTSEQQRDALPAIHRVASCHAGAMTEGRAPQLKIEQEPCAMEAMAQDHPVYQ